MTRLSSIGAPAVIMAAVLAGVLSAAQAETVDGRRVVVIDGGD